MEQLGMILHGEIKMLPQDMVFGEVVVIDTFIQDQTLVDAHGSEQVVQHVYTKVLVRILTPTL